MSFSDMSLVLLCFFVLLLSMSTINKTRYDNLKDGMTAKEGENNKETLEALAQKIQEEIKRKKLQSFAEVKLDIDGLSVELKDRLLFAPGSARPNQQFDKHVKGVLNIISKSPDRYKAIIEGHTDDTPMRGGRYKSNWELSSARGIVMMKKLKSLGFKEERSSVVSYAHTQPKVAITGLKGDALKKARASNRRVVIRLE